MHVCLRAYSTLFCVSDLLYTHLQLMVMVIVMVTVIVMLMVIVMVMVMLMVMVMVAQKLVIPAVQLSYFEKTEIPG